MRKVVLLLVVGLIVSTTVFGQRSTATLSGTITDVSGAVVPQAQVTATDVSTGSTAKALSNAEGFYIITNLLPSVYRLQVQKSGFETYSQENITLEVDRDATVRVSLTVGSQTQRVTVTGETSQVDLRSPTVTYSVPPEMIVGLPLNGRNVTQLMALAPDSGVTSGGYQGNSSFFQSATRPEDQFALVSANGGNGASTAFYLDGALNEDGYTNVANIYPNPDAIQEFSYETNNYSAKFSGRGGAVMNAVTRGGANQFHGTAFEFLRNYDLDANNFFATSSDGLRRNQYGGTIGGPVKRDNTFFFFAYQRTSLNSVPSANIQTALTQEQRNGDFSSDTQQLINPDTGLPFPGNQIPTGLFNPVSVAQLAYIPVGAPGTGLAQYSTTEIQNSDQYVTRVDHNFGAKFRLYGSYLYDSLNEPDEEDPKNLLTATRSNNWKSQDLTLNGTYLFRPNLLATFVGSVSRRGYLTNHPGPPKGLPGFQDLGMQGVPKLSPPGTTEVVVRVTNYMDSVLGGAQGRNYSTEGDLGTYWTYIKASHTFEFGGEVELQKQVTAQDFLGDGYVTFGGNLSGDNAADYLLGKPNFFEQAADVYRVPARNLPGLYFVDTWKTTRRLTLTLGLRWNPMVPILDVHHEQAIFSQTAFNQGIHSTKYVNLPPGLLVDGDPNLPGGSVFPAHYRIFNPRVGFAYDVYGTGKTSIRGGYGMYVGQMSGIDASSQYNPFTLTVAVNFPISFTAPYAGSGVTNPFPIVGTLPSNYPFQLPIPSSPYAPGLSAPIIQQWNLTLEQQLPAAVLMRVAYEGAESYHLFGGIEGNQSVYNPALSQSQNSLTTQARRPMGQYYQGLSLGSTIGTASYNALVASVEKRMSHGLTGLAGYRWSKCLDEGESPFLNGNSYSTNNPAYDRGRCSYDVTNQFVLSYVDHLPDVKEFGLLGRQVLSGWQTSGIVTLRSGLPYGVSYTFDNALIGGGGNRANLVGNPNLPGNRPLSQKLLLWFNPNAFVENPVGTLGTSGKDSLTGPGFANIDFAVIKSFPISMGHFSDAAHLDFRAEAFNVLNHPNFNNPNANMNSETVGRITSALSPRIMQFSLKFIF